MHEHVKAISQGMHFSVVWIGPIVIKAYVAEFVLGKQMKGILV